MATQVAKLSYLKIAPRKVRLITDSLKGMTTNEAEAALMLRPNRSAKPILKLLRSAVSNAKNNQKLSGENLVIESILVNQGPMLKRHLPRARGMATPIQKKMSHIILTLEEAGVSENRFKIVVQKKLKDKKLDKETKKVKEKEGRAEEKQVSKQSEKPGMLKRFFRRKVV